MADNVTPINGEQDEPTPAQTVAELKAAMTDRHGRGLIEAEKRLNGLAVAVVKREAGERIERTATELADVARCLADNRPHLVFDPADPVREAHRLLTNLVLDFSVVEYLNGRGARRIPPGTP